MIGTFISAKKCASKFEGKDLERYFLRNLFIDEQDGKIAQLIWNYFFAVKHKWGSYWDNVEPSIILNRSGGLLLVMKFFKDAYHSFGRDNAVYQRRIHIHF